MDPAIGPKIVKLAPRHSERDGCHHVIEMRRHFPHAVSGQWYESATNFTNEEPRILKRTDVPSDLGANSMAKSQFRLVDGMVDLAHATLVELGDDAVVGDHLLPSHCAAPGFAAGTQCVSSSNQFTTTCNLA
jgi:hypothetical protein